MSLYPARDFGFSEAHLVNRRILGLKPPDKILSLFSGCLFIDCCLGDARRNEKHRPVRRDDFARGRSASVQHAKLSPIDKTLCFLYSRPPLPCDVNRKICIRERLNGGGFVDAAVDLNIGGWIANGANTRANPMRICSTVLRLCARDDYNPFARELDYVL